MIPVIAYAVKSSADPKDSTGTQIAHVEAAIARGHDAFKSGDRFFYAPADTFREEGRSGYTGNRGPELERAIQTAVRAAGEHGGYAELWVAITSRLGRGSGKLGESRSYMKLWADLQAEGVQLRSVDDDQFATLPALVGIASEQNYKYSADISANVKRAKGKMLDAGKRLGGPVCDGYLRRVERDPKTDELVRTWYEIDPEREPVFRRLFALALAGHGCPAIAKMLNAEGHRTGRENAWNRRRVQDTLKNGWYAGYVEQKSEKIGAQRVMFAEVRRVKADHPAYLTETEFQRIQDGFAQRDRSAKGREKAASANGGRPTTVFALAKLAKCGHCGSGMYVLKSPYKRKDGSHARHYVCAHVRDGDGLCRAPKVDAETADAAIIPHLQGFCVDFEAWAASVSDSAMADVRALEVQADSARDRLARLKAAQTGAHDRWVAALSEGDETTAETLLTALTRIGSDLSQAEASLADLEAAVSEATATATTDEMLDVWASLSEALRGKLDGAPTMEAVNAELRAVLEAVEIATLENGGIRMLAIFKTRGSHEPITDQHGEFTGEWDFIPDTVEFLTAGRKPLPAPPALPIETGRNAQTLHPVSVALRSVPPLVIPPAAPRAREPYARRKRALRNSFDNAETAPTSPTV